MVQRGETLARIRDAEKKRKEMEDEAKKHKELILQKAKLSVQTIIDEATAAAESAAAERMRAEAHKIQDERKVLTTANDKEIARLREGSRGRLGQAAGFIVSEFVRQSNA